LYILGRVIGLNKRRKRNEENRFTEAVVWAVTAAAVIVGLFLTRNVLCLLALNFPASKDFTFSEEEEEDTEPEDDTDE